MGKLEGIFVYDIDDLQAVAAAHLEERRGQAGDAESLIAGEVERFHQKQRTVNAAPVIVALQKHAEEMRMAELKRLQTRLEGLTPEQQAAIEALTRGLVNKLLHPPMQAFKQAARENNQVRIDALCEAWHLDVDGSQVSGRETFGASPSNVSNSDKPTEKVSETAEESVGESASRTGVETHQ
jgi:glutamyl-tRNA reductase